jgi:hypothetical protein
LAWRGNLKSRVYQYTRELAHRSSGSGSRARLRAALRSSARASAACSRGRLKVWSTGDDRPSSVRSARENVSMSTEVDRLDLDEGRSRCRRGSDSILRLPSSLLVATLGVRLVVQHDHGFDDRAVLSQRLTGNELTGSRLRVPRRRALLVVMIPPRPAQLTEPCFRSASANCEYPERFSL